MKIKPKTKTEIHIMQEGGKRLKAVKEVLNEKVAEGVSVWEIEEEAVKQIAKSGGSASFKMVPRYKWATCINVNEGVVHGIPKKEVVFGKGDIVSVDVGLYYQGFHTDTSFSKGLSPSSDNEAFLQTGREAFSKAYKAAVAGNRIYDISLAIEQTLGKHGLNPVKALVGHGVGRQLHEEPQIPGFTQGGRENSPEIPEGAVFAIEVIYTKGAPDIQISNDGWTISMRDGKISALWEDTVLVGKKGPVLLT